MRAFIDTSSLFKKYVEETGSREFNDLLESISEIIVSPITILEIHSVIERRLRDRTLSLPDSKWVEKEFMIDYDYFGIVQWSDDLMRKSILLIHNHQLRVLDGIQLSAALLSKAPLFITSDRRLFESAKKELLNVKFV